MALTPPGTKVRRSLASATPPQTEQMIAQSDAPTLTPADTSLAGSLIMARNGLLQWDQEDFTLTGQALDLPHVQAGDRMVVRYQVQ